MAANWRLQVTIGSNDAQPGAEHLSKNERLVRDWQAIGLDAKLTVLPSPKAATRSGAPAKSR